MREPSWAEQVLTRRSRLAGLKASWLKSKSLRWLFREGLPGFGSSSPSIPVAKKERSSLFFVLKGRLAILDCLRLWSNLKLAREVEHSVRERVRVEPVMYQRGKLETVPNPLLRSWGKFRSRTIQRPTKPCFPNPTDGRTSQLHSKLLLNLTP